MSLRARIVNLVLRVFEKRRLMRDQTPEELRRGFERSARLFFHPPRGSRFAATNLGGVPTLKCTGSGARADRALLYFHGGGYVMGSPRTHRAMLARLSQMTGCVAWLPDYGMAPEHPFPAAINDALAVYGVLIETIPPEHVVIGGDSAGGGLALALLGEIGRKGLPQPTGTFAFSPLTDMSFSGPSFVENREAEAMLPASRTRDLQDIYLAGHDPHDPRASPLFAGFQGAGPVWLSVGDTEILLDDTRRMAEQLRAQGVRVEVEMGRDLPHVWPMFQHLMPEAEATLRRLASWINSLPGWPGES